MAAANQEFEAKHPGTNVDVQYQTWGDHLSKFDATLAGGNTPDVIEMGNTEMTKYMAAGAFANLTSQKGSFANSKNWLKGLAASGIYNGKTYGVPYYAGSRVVTYRTDLFRQGSRQDADEPRGVHRDGQAARVKQNNKQGLLAGLHRRHRLVLRDELRLRLRRPDRRRSRTASGSGSSSPRRRRPAWPPTSGSSPPPRAASKTGTENRPQPYDVYSQGKAASIVGPAWFSCCVGKKYTKATKQFVMPSHVKGQGMPGFLGGSDLAVPAGSNDKSLAADWIRIFTSTAGEKGLQAKGNIPNATNLLGNSVNERAAKRSWFVPTAKNWVNVENGNVLRTMLARILTGKASIAQATAFADSNIELTLNQ